MFNLDSITNENNEDHNLKWPYFPDHSYRMLIIGCSGSKNPPKTNGVLNLIKEQDSDSLIDKINLHTKDLSELKYQFLILEYLKCMDDVYNNIDSYNPLRKRKILIVFDDIIADIMTNKKFQAIIKELLSDA